MSQTHIYVAIPTYSGDLKVECLASLMNLQRVVTAPPINGKVTLTWQTHTFVPIARNILTHRFMNDLTATHIFFVDDDMGFSECLIAKLLKHRSRVAAAFYPARTIPFDNILKHSKHFSSVESMLSALAKYTSINDIVQSDHAGRKGIYVDDDGFVQVKSIGAGLMLIERSVFDTISNHYPELTYSTPNSVYKRCGLEDAVLHCFDLMSQNGEIVGEDISFCRRWIGAGGEIWACVDEETMHVGRTVSKGTLLDQIKFNSEPHLA